MWQHTRHITITRPVKYRYYNDGVVRNKFQQDWFPTKHIKRASLNSKTNNSKNKTRTKSRTTTKTTTATSKHEYKNSHQFTNHGQITLTCRNWRRNFTILVLVTSLRSLSRQDNNQVFLVNSFTLKTAASVCNRNNSI